jgi:hypothetical protein
MGVEISLAGASEIQCDRMVHLRMWPSFRATVKGILERHAVERTAP